MVTIVYPINTQFLRLCSALTVLLVAAISLQGCSTFNRDWNHMESTAAAERGSQPMLTGLSGRWKGTWRSNSNGHHGELRCIITEDESGSLRARYRARYGWFFTFEYDMPMTAERIAGTEKRSEAYRFSASADLGWLAGGVYAYEGTVTGDVFHSTYTSSGDHGTFEMRRVRADSPADEN